MVPTPRLVSLDDGTVVGLYEYGDPDGAPVLTFHGVPACGAGFAWADEPARIRGLRVLAPDRPGVGRSTPRPGWTIADHVATTATLADALGIDRFAVWGYSGGGPFAVAAAATLGPRVTACAVAAGMGQVGAWATIDDFEKTDRQFLRMAARRPGLARLLLGITGRAARLAPKTAMGSFAGQLSASDREVLSSLGEPREAMALFTEAFTHGARGVVDDYRAIGGPWGADLDGIEAPVAVFHGTDDTMVPLRHGEELARRIAGAQLVTWPGEGHLGTVAHVEEILDWVVQASRRPA